MFTGGIPFEPPHDGAAAALAALEAAIADAAAAAIPSSSSSSSNAGATTEAPAGLAAPAATGAPLGEAVALRLRLRRALHLGLLKASSCELKVIVRQSVWQDLRYCLNHEAQHRPPVARFERNFGPP